MATVTQELQGAKDLVEAKGGELTPLANMYDSKGTAAPQEDVTPAQPASLPQIELEEPVQSPTVVSTDSMREQLQGAEDSLKQMKAEIEAKPEQPAQVEAPVVEAPKEPSPTDFIDEYTKETNKILNDRKREFDRYATRSDGLLRSQVNSIQSTFDERRQEAEKVAANAKAATNVLGARTGRMRYAPEIQRGIITGQENALIETLSTIDSQELAAIAAAEEAAFNRDYGTFLDKIDSLDGIRKEREQKLDELQEVMKVENERRKEEAETLRQETLIIEQFAAGVTDPVEIFQATNGEVPYDMIVQYATTVPEAVAPGEFREGELEFKTGTSYQPAGFFNTRTGEFTRIGGAAALGSSISQGGSVVGTGGAGVVGFPTDSDIKNMSTEARDFVNKVMRQLPTKLKDSEQEKQERMKEALFDFNRGRGIQEVVDEMNGFVIQDKEGQNLANVFRSYAIGSGVDLAEISAAINNGNPTQAMTTIERAKLDDVDLFFASLDDSRGYVEAINEAESILNDPEFNEDFLGSWDGRQFKAERFFGADANDRERQLLQRLETQLAIINSPIRVSVAGTAATDAEMQKIQPLQADILDNPATMKTILNQMQTSILQFHNAARGQRGLPEVSEEQLISNRKRLNLYKSQVKEIEESQQASLSNKDLLLGGTETTETTTASGVPSVLEGL